MSESEIEARLTETLRAVADQTTAESKLGFLPSADIDPAPTPGVRARGLWLAAAAAVAVIGGTAAYLVVTGGDGPDIGTTEPAEEPAIDLDRVDDEGNPVEASPDPDGDGDGNPGRDGDRQGSGLGTAPSDLTVTLPDPDAGDTLYLVPADRSGLIEDVDLATGSEVSNSTSLSIALIGRQTDGTIERASVVYQANADDPFAIDRETSQILAGVEVFDSFDEGVARELGDGTWIVYQTEFGDPDLEELVAGVDIVDGVITFEADPESDAGLELVAVAERIDPDASMTVIHEPEGDPTQAPDGRGPGFRLFTTRADDPTEAAVHAADFAASELRETTIGDRPGYIFSVGMPEGSVSIIGWSPVDGYVAAMIVFGPDEADAIDFAASMVPVDQDTWRTEFGG